VIAGGVSANRKLRSGLASALAAERARVYYPAPEFCTDNGAMIAYAGALRLAGTPPADGRFGVRPRWELSSLEKA
jgi:N6-L-threonylcarbamoyladenine synthase